MTTSSLTVGPAHGQLLLRTTAEGRAARIGHDLTLVVRDWQVTAQLVDGEPQAVAAEIHLDSLQVVRGEGGLKPLTAGDKRKVLEAAATTIGRSSLARYTCTTITDRWTLEGSLDLHGVRRPHRVQVGVANAGGQLRITGTTTVRQTDFGITPYEQMMGTLKVGNLVQVLVEVLVPAQP